MASRFVDVDGPWDSNHGPVWVVAVMTADDLVLTAQEERFFEDAIAEGERLADAYTCDLVISGGVV